MDGWMDGNVALVEEGLYMMHFEDGAWNILNVHVGPSYTEKKTQARGHGLDRIMLFGRCRGEKNGLASSHLHRKFRGIKQKKNSKPIIYIDVHCFPWLFQGVSLEALQTNDGHRKHVGHYLLPLSSSKLCRLYTTTKWSSWPPLWRFGPCLHVMKPKHISKGGGFSLGISFGLGFQMYKSCNIGSILTLLKAHHLQVGGPSSTPSLKAVFHPSNIV